MTTSQIIAIALASIAQFIFGAIWYMPIFGKTWGEIHGFDKASKSEQKKMQTAMMPLLLVQFIVTVITTVVLAKLMILLPTVSPYSLAVMAWIGFQVPVQVSGVIFGGTNPRWINQKISIMAGGALTCLFIAVTILNFFI